MTLIETCRVIGSVLLSNEVIYEDPKLQPVQF